MGDRAVHTLLDVYERVLNEVPSVPKGALLLEHGGLSFRGAFNVWVVDL